MDEIKIEKNCATFIVPWNPNDDIGDLWLRIHNAQMLAHRAGEEIKDPVAICLTLRSLEASSVFDFALDSWRLKDDATKMMATSKKHFNKEDTVVGNVAPLYTSIVVTVVLQTQVVRPCT
jgi:hypothetical protein